MLDYLFLQQILFSYFNVIDIIIEGWNSLVNKSSHWSLPFVADILEVNTRNNKHEK
jgi:hypothetical protein